MKMILFVLMAFFTLSAFACNCTVLEITQDNPEVYENGGYSVCPKPSGFFFRGANTDLCVTDPAKFMNARNLKECRDFAIRLAQEKPLKETDKTFLSFSWNYKGRDSKRGIVTRETPIDHYTYKEDERAGILPMIPEPLYHGNRKIVYQDFYSNDCR